jgi:hypothetical protein
MSINIKTDVRHGGGFEREIIIINNNKINPVWDFDRRNQRL